MNRPPARPIAEELAADREAALRLVSVSRETEERLAAFVDLLGRWRGKTNLIANSTFARVWTRHIANLPSFSPLRRRRNAGSTWARARAFRASSSRLRSANAPGAIVHCVESDRRKCAFLREAARLTGAAAMIHPARVEAIDPESLGPVDAVTARAFAPLPLALELAKPWLERGATAVFPRGESARGQIAALPEAWAYAIEALGSVVDPKAAILRIRRS